MKKIHGIALTTAAAFIVGMVGAETIVKSSNASKKVVTTAPRAKVSQFDLSIRYVDSFAAIGESAEGKVATKKLTEKRDELTNEIREMEQKITTSAKELQAKLPTLSEAGREREQKTMVKMERKYKAKIQESDEDLKSTIQGMQERMMREHRNAVAQYAKENGIDILLSPVGVIYASEKANCTSAVVKNMNKQYDIKLAKSKGQAPSTAVASGKSTGRTAAV